MVVKIVTDSTADIPKSMAEELGIEVVPLKVRFGEEEFLDGVDLTPDEFYRRLTSSAALPVTSQPSVGEFAETYRRVAEGSDGIVSIHVSSLVSGTMQAATQAKDWSSCWNRISRMNAGGKSSRWRPSWPVTRPSR